MITVFIVLISMLVAADVGAEIKTEAVHGLEDSDMWVKVEQMSEAEALAARGLKREARLLLDSLLERYPDYDEAKRLYDTLGANTGDDSASRDRTAAEKSDKAEMLWREYKELRGAADLSGARKKLLEIKSLYADGGVRPSFLSDLEKEYGDVERVLANALAGVFAEIEEKLAEILRNNDLDARLAGLIKIYALIEKILSEKGDIPRAVELRDKIIGNLNRAARVAYSKAAMIGELGGCPLSAPAFKKLVNALARPELEIYQMAKRKAEACEK